MLRYNNGRRDLNVYRTKLPLDHRITYWVAEGYTPEGREYYETFGSWRAAFDYADQMARVAEIVLPPPSSPPPGSPPMTDVQYWKIQGDGPIATYASRKGIAIKFDALQDRVFGILSPDEASQLAAALEAAAQFTTTTRKETHTS